MCITIEPIAAGGRDGFSWRRDEASLSSVSSEPFVGFLISNFNGSSSYKINRSLSKWTNGKIHRSDEHCGVFDLRRNLRAFGSEGLLTEEFRRGVALVIFQDQGKAHPVLVDVVGRPGHIVPTGQLGERLSHIDLKVLDKG